MRGALATLDSCACGTDNRCAEQTHDLFKCKRCKGGKQTIKAPAMLYGDTSTCVLLSVSRTLTFS